MEIFDSLSGDWDIRYRKKTNYKRRVELIDLVMKDMPKNINILDYGCATGYISSYLAASGHRVTGVDISEEMLDTARKRKGNNPLGLEFVDAKEASFYKDNYFDIIICLNTFEYMDNPEAFLREAYRLLKNQGRLFISIPNTKSIFYHLQHKIYNINKKYTHIRIIDKILYYVPYQKNLLKRENLQETLGDFNFITTKVFYYSLPFNSIRLNRWIVNSERFGMQIAVLFLKTG